jgi:hypothetical protein
MMKYQMRKENSMKYSKYLTISILICSSLINWACDNRVPEDSQSSTNSTIDVTETQAIADEGGERVGEVVSGSSSMRIVAILKNESGQAFKDKTISFSHNGQGGDFSNGVNVITDENGQVVNVFKPNSSEKKVDATTTPDFEGLVVTLIYGTSPVARVEFNVYQDKDDVWPYTINVSSDVDNIKLDNGETTAQITAQLFNKTNTPLHNVILLFNSNKGYIDGEGTTDSTGSVTMTFRDNGDQEDIGLANIICSFNHSGFDSEIADTVNVRIGSNNNLILETTPISYENGSSQILVGEDIIGDIALTRIVATILDTSGNGIFGQIISLKATSLGASVGSLEIISSETDHEGKFYAYFDDGGNSYLDIAGTTEFDGVVITAYLGDSTSTTTAISNLNVYPDDAWPYLLYLNSDVDQILLDNGVTTAEIEARVVNQYDALVKNVTLNFESDKGTIDPTGVTDSTGVITLTFSDNGTQDDIGLANIQASFEHPGFSATVTDSVQITIGTNNGLSLQIIPVSYDATGSTVIVGEDVSGDAAVTLLVATVMDSMQNPIAGTPVEFVATHGGGEVGSIAYDNSISNADGQVIAKFDDGGNVYKDNPGTPNYEGVIIVATFGEKTTDPENFNVYPEEDVWPYNLFVNTDTDVISLDGGETIANIHTRLLNKLGNPVGNAQINYTASLGFIAATGFTDSVGVDSVSFTDLGNPEDVGVSDIMSTFSHPGFDGILIQDSLQVYIEDPSFQSCAFMEIPSSIPGNIVVRNGGGLESTFIRAEVYDDNGTLINTPTPVVFTMEPLVGNAYLEVPGQTTATIYTVNGIATVSINSGTDPGPVRIVATCDCDQDGVVDLTSTDVPVIIASGAPYHIEAEYDPNSTEAIGGGFYQTECAVIVSDLHYNPVEDSTYVYWSIDPLLPDTVIDAFVEGVSFTNNEGILSGIATSGVARSNIVYSTDAIGDIGRVRALTFGAGGDSVVTYINEDEGDATLFFLPGQVSLMANATYWDFTLNGNPALVQITAIVIDFYGNAVSGAPIAFNGTGINAFYEVGYETYIDEGVLGAGEGDLCFTWRDYGLDDRPETLDWGTYNDNHDGFDVDGDGIIDTSEIAEPFDDFGFDGVDLTFDQGEANGEWDGYSMLGCEPIVKTDEDGFARIIVEFDQALCTLANEDDDGICTWDDFTASISATLLIPEITTSEPLDILLVRSPAACD